MGAILREMITTVKKVVKMRERGQYGEESPKRAGEGAPPSRLRWLSREEDGQREGGSQEVRERALRPGQLPGDAGCGAE